MPRSPVPSPRRSRRFPRGRTLAAAAVAVAAAVGAGAETAGGVSRDWLLPSEVAPGGGELRRVAAGAEAGTPCPTCAEAAIYRAFDGDEFEVLRYAGRHVEMLVPAGWLAHFTPEELLDLLDTADHSYEVLRDLVGREPGGVGRLRVAYVDPSCGIACGLVGGKGVEIWPGELDDGSYEEDYLRGIADAARLSVPHDFLRHELSHNFDVYSGYLQYHDDSAHFWTDVLAYSYVWGMMEGDVRTGLGRIDGMQWFERERSLAEGPILRYAQHPGRSWQACVRDGACGDLVPRTVRAALPLAIFRAAGPAAAPGAMEHLRQRQIAGPAPATPEAREELWIEALADGAGVDLTGCLAALSWHSSPELAARLAGHGPPAPFCADGDGDGVIGLIGDCAPGDPAIGPGRPEAPNGVDDDCNGLVDESLVALPSLSGRADQPTQLPAPPVAADFDVVRNFSFLQVRPSSNRVTARLCSPVDGFRGFVAADRGADLPLSSTIVERGGCAMLASTAVRGQQLSIWLNMEPDFGDQPGPTRMAVGAAPPWPGPWGGVGLVPLPGGGYELSATVADPSAFRQPADRVRFAVSGYGTVGTAPLGPGSTARFEWPGDPAAGPHRLEAQPYAGELPAGPPQSAAFDPGLLAPCVPGPETACLLGGRFEVTGTMRDFESPPNTLPVRVMEFPGGRAESEQAAFFESFNRGNFEIGVKMVDGCPLPEGHPNRFFWLFVGGLTTAETVVRVEDTVSGAMVEWTNPPGTLPTTTGDTAAFACGGAPEPGACVPGDEAACLLGRFRVTGTMRDFESPPNDHPLRVMELPGGRAETEQAAFFESFNPGNFEIGVKMVDACALPPGNPIRAYWLFTGGLTNARTDLRVRHVSTGQVYDWVNPAGVLPTSLGDTAAFPCL